MNRYRMLDFFQNLHITSEHAPKDYRMQKNQFPTRTKSWQSQTPNWCLQVTTLPLLLLLRHTHLNQNHPESSSPTPSPSPSSNLHNYKIRVKRDFICLLQHTRKVMPQFLEISENKQCSKQRTILI
jgi:hypothetical protein